MKATTSIKKADIITSSATQSDGRDKGNTSQAQEAHAGTENETAHQGKPESELRAAARRHGLTLKELAHLMGVSYGHLCSVASGRRPWTPMLRERVMAVQGEVPGPGVVYHQGGRVTSESSCAPRDAA